MPDADAASPSDSTIKKHSTNQIPRIAKLISGKIHFACDAGGALYFYQNGVYRPGGEKVIKKEVRNLLSAGDVSWTPQKGRDVAEYIAIGAPTLMERPPLDLINLQTGILDWKTGKLRKHSPDFLSTTQLPVIYDPKAKSVAWREYIKAAFPQDSLELPWEIVAWLMLPISTIQKAMLLVGGRGTGKSTFLRALRAFLGAENTSASPLHYLEGNRFATTRLIGKLANICPDIADTRMDTTNVFKALTGGDPITAEYKGGAIFDILPYCRLVFSANTLPTSTDISGAFTERWHVYHLFKKFENRTGATVDLDSRLAAPAELSGVLNEALAVLPRIMKSGLSVAPSMESVLETMRAQQNPAADWVSMHLEASDYSDFLTFSQIADAANGVVKDRVLADTLQALIPTSQAIKKYVDGVQQRVRIGIKWSNYHKNQHLQ